MSVHARLETAMVRLAEPGAGDAAELNKALIRRMFERSINEGDLSVFDGALDPAFVLYAPTLDEPGHGVAAIRRFVTGLRTGFPDITVSIEQLLAEGDCVAIRFRTTRQTHRGRYLGIPPTGRAVTMTGMGMFRLRAGRVEEMRLELNALGAAQQLGVVPPNRISTARRIAFVLGSLVRVAFLEARFGAGRSPGR
jgi:predicted ester cyclase